MRARLTSVGHIDDDGEIGHDIADGEAVDLRDGIGGEVAADALINRGRVEKPIAQARCPLRAGRGR